MAHKSPRAHESMCVSDDRARAPTVPMVFTHAGMYPKNPWGRTNGKGHAPKTTFGTALIERLTEEGEALCEQYKPVEQPKRSATPLPRSAKKSKSGRCAGRRLTLPFRVKDYFTHISVLSSDAAA